MDDPRSRAGTLLGDYRLDRFLAESPATVTWLAEQVSIRRPVLLVELKPSALAERNGFLADARAQAAVDHPLIGSVYEAVSREDHCFVAFERLPGPSLAERLAAGEALKPLLLAQVLRRTAEAELHLESAGVGVRPLGPESVHLDAHGVVRLANRAAAHSRGPERSTEDVRRFGETLRRLVADGHPGASRIATVLAWMRGEEIGRVLTWREVHEYATQIERQLTETAGAATPSSRPPAGKNRLPVVTGVAVALAAAAVAAIFVKGRKPALPQVPLPPPLTVAGGAHPAPDGGSVELPSFELASHEVTIGEYAEFLVEIARLPEERRRDFDAPGQPAAKTGHEPDDWAAMYAAARSGGKWQDRPISPGHPVVNVDWWDAAAYCNWKVVKLPTQDQWFAALRRKLDDPATLKAAAWCAVADMPAADRTPAGLLGMAGSVAEWTREPAVNPANPLGAKSHVIIGASFLKPAGGALAREWTGDLLQRRPDLGFRVARDLR